MKNHSQHFPYTYFSAIHTQFFHFHYIFCNWFHRINLYLILFSFSINKLIFSSIHFALYPTVDFKRQPKRMNHTFWASNLVWNFFSFNPVTPSIAGYTSASSHIYMHNYIHIRSLYVQFVGKRNIRNRIKDSSPLLKWE